MSDQPPEQPDWKFACLATLKQLHEALDVIEAIDSECILPPQLQDMVDQALYHRQIGEQTALTTPEGT